MKSDFNLAKETVAVSQTTSSKVTIEKALEAFQIEKVVLPLRNGKLQEIKNGFVGSVNVKMKNGIYLSLSLLKSRLPSSTTKYYIPDARASIFLPDEDNATYTAVGNTVDGATREDGTERKYASAFIPKDMFAFLRKYVNMLAEEVEYVEIESSQASNSEGETEAATV